MNHYFKINWQNPTIYLTFLAAAYFLFNAVTQYLTSSTAVLDQAEQLILSQTWQAGYSEQPPLYTYFTFLVFTIIPPSLIGLFFIKVIILSSTVFFLLRIGVLLNFTDIQLKILFFSLPFIPFLVIIPQYDLTHSVLATLFAIVTLYLTIRLEKEKNISLYALLGIVVACGLLSKYNYAIFLAAIFLTVLVNHNYRPIILHKYILLSFIITLILIAPHLNWVWQHLDTIKQISSNKLHLDTETNAFKGFITAFTEAIIYLSPLWLLSFLLIKLKKILVQNNQTTKKIFLLLLISIITLMTIFIFSTGTSYIKARWYQPILFFIVLLPALYANTLEKLKYYKIISLTIIIATIIIIPIRIIYAKNFHHFSKPNIPYPSLIQTLARTNPEIINILAENQLLAGNARPYFPKATILTAKYLLNLPLKSGNTLILCETENCKSVLFQQEASSIYQTDIQHLKFNTLTQPYYYSSGTMQKTIYYAVTKH